MGPDARRLARTTRRYRHRLSALRTPAGRLHRASGPWAERYVPLRGRARRLTA